MHTILSLLQSSIRVFLINCFALCYTQSACSRKAEDYVESNKAFCVQYRTSLHFAVGNLSLGTAPADSKRPRLPKVGRTPKELDLLDHQVCLNAVLNWLLMVYLQIYLRQLSLDRSQSANVPPDIWDMDYYDRNLWYILYQTMQWFAGWKSHRNWSPSLVAKDIELDAIGCQLEPHPYWWLHLHAGGVLVVWPGMMFPNS